MAARVVVEVLGDAALSPDGKEIVTTGDDGTPRIRWTELADPVQRSNGLPRRDSLASSNQASAKRISRRFDSGTRFRSGWVWSERPGESGAAFARCETARAQPAANEQRRRRGVLGERSTRCTESFPLPVVGEPDDDECRLPGGAHQLLRSWGEKQRFCGDAKCALDGE